MTQSLPILPGMATSPVWNAALRPATPMDSGISVPDFADCLDNAYVDSAANPFGADHAEATHEPENDNGQVLMSEMDATPAHTTDGLPDSRQESITPEERPPLPSSAPTIRRPLHPRPELCTDAPTDGMPVLVLPPVPVTDMAVRLPPASGSLIQAAPSLLIQDISGLASTPVTLAVLSQDAMLQAPSAATALPPELPSAQPGGNDSTWQMPLPPSSQTASPAFNQASSDDATLSRFSALEEVPTASMPHPDSLPAAPETADAPEPAAETAGLLPAGILHDTAIMHSRTPVSLPATPSALPAPDVHADDFPAHLAPHIHWLVERNIQHAHIHITPPELGTLDIRLSLEGKHLSASFTSAHSEVQQSLQHSLPQLKQMLAEHGLQLAQADVNQHPHRQPTRDSATAGTDTDLSTDTLEHAVRMEQPSRSLHTRHLLDAWV